MTLLGAFVGGGLALRFGVMRILMLGALLSSLSNLLFAWLAGYGHSVIALLSWVISKFYTFLIFLSIFLQLFQFLHNFYIVI